MRPNYLSIDEYGTPVFEHLLMYINGIKAVEDFSMDKIIIPNKESVVQLAYDRVPYTKPGSMRTVNW